MPDIKDAETKLKGSSKQEKVIAKHLIDRCKEDPSMLEDVLKNEKTFAGCIRYIRHQAQKKATGGWYMAEDSEVFEWAEDYFRKADTEAEKEQEKKKKAVPIKEDKKEKPKTEHQISKSAQKMPKTKNKKPKKKSKENDDGDIEGQMSIFDFM